MNARYLPPIDDGQFKRLGDARIDTALTRSCVNERMEFGGRRVGHLSHSIPPNPAYPTESHLVPANPAKKNLLIHDIPP